MSYVVRCRSAAGIARELRVTAQSESAACRQAQRELERDYPGQRWIPEVVL